VKFRKALGDTLNQLNISPQKLYEKRGMFLLENYIYIKDVFTRGPSPLLQQHFLI
jgi:hypothetical protein